MEMILAIWFSRRVQQRNPNGLVCRLLLGLNIYWSINTSCPRYARDRMSRHWTQEKKVATFQKSKVTIYYHRHLLKVFSCFPSVTVLPIISPTLSSIAVTIYYHLSPTLFPFPGDRSHKWRSCTDGEVMILKPYSEDQLERSSNHPYSTHQLEGLQYGVRCIEISKVSIILVWIIFILYWYNSKAQTVNWIRSQKDKKRISPCTIISSIMSIWNIIIF